MYTSPTDVLTDTEKKYKVNTYLMEKGFRINAAATASVMAPKEDELKVVPKEAKVSKLFKAGTKTSTTMSLANEGDIPR